MSRRWRTVRAAVGCWLITTAAAPARADWFEARTDHFVVDIDTDEAGARDYAGKLERFDAALRRLYGVADDPGAHSNRVRIFALKPSLFTAVCQCSSAVGYFRPQAGGSAIFGMYDPRVDAKASKGELTSQVVVLHEYTHHFMFSSDPIAYPIWYSEGFAEFNANTRFESDGSVTIGLPANYRGDVIQDDHIQVTPADFFGATQGYPAIYGRGWLLTHYLLLTPKRTGQLATYLRLMNSGKSSVEAATAAFGDLALLYRDMFAYLHGKSLAPPLSVPPPVRPIRIEVERLSPGAAGMMPLWARASNGPGQGRAEDIARDAEVIGTRYPGDPRVAAQLAEIELLAGRFDAGEAAADRALALDPGSVAAMTFKGAAIGRGASAAKAGEAAAWRSARGWFLKANHADPNAALPLIRYYQSFVAAGDVPTPGAVTGLRRAVILAPDDASVRVLLARYTIDHDDVPSARALLQPIAYAPHFNPRTNVAAQVIALIDAGKIAEARALMSSDSDKHAKGDRSR